jgi:hypothetical protein
MCSILSRESCVPLFKKKQRKMGAIEALLASTGGAVVGQAMNWVDETLFGNKRRKQQIEQQKKLTDLQVQANKELADYGMGISKEMFDYTGYENQVKQMKAAGLNPALMYGHAGSGGTTVSSSAGSASGSQASDETSRKLANMQVMGMGLQMQKMGAEVRKLEADAKKAEADAKKAESEAKTREELRAFEKELLRQEGIEKWLQNLRENLKNSGQLANNEMQMFRNNVLDEYTAFQSTGYWNQEITAAIAKALAEAKNLEALAELNTEKKKGYWTELLNATKNADSEAAKAAAMKLATEWSTGEYTNWKTWVDIGKDAIGTVAKILPFVK